MNVSHLLITFLLGISILLSGCSQRVQEIQVKNKAEEKIPLNLEMPAQLKPKKVQWFIITPENAEEVWKQMNESKLDLVIIGVSDEGYQNISVNTAELMKYLLEQKDIIKAYKEYYETKE